MRVEFHGITFDLPDGWTDITDDLPDGSPPTLARPSGVGAIQFSIAKYGSGADPKATVSDLRKFCAEFCVQHAIDESWIVEYPARMMCVGAKTNDLDEFLAAWYLSNGRDFVFVTYVGVNEDIEQSQGEFDDAQLLVESISA